MEKTMPPTEEVQILPFKALIDRFDCYLLDAYGVFWGSSESGMLPGARETMEHLVSLGKQVGILSNSTQLAAKEKEKLARHGVLQGTHYHFLLTSGEVAKEILASENLPFPTPNKKYCLFGAEHPRFSTHTALFQGSAFSQALNFEEADFIYIPVPHIGGLDQENPEAFQTLVEEIASKGLPVLCANPDRFAHEGLPPRLVVRQGTIARMLEDLGAKVHFIGKPFSTVYEKALQLFPCPVQPREVLMIGDTPETDIRGARRMGLSSALVTKTGVMRDRIGEEKASVVISQLSQSEYPDYAIECFDLR
jgi:HAD superfamily hydrolase (TIGR01459 family)